MTAYPSADLPIGAPTAAHQTTLALLHDVLVEVARRRQDELPGLTESLQDDVVVADGGTSRPASGWFAGSAWRHGDRYVHELFINADLRHRHPDVSKAEDVLITLFHEGCHVWARAQNIEDTSRENRYHNRRFAEIALAIGLTVTPDPVVGHRPPGLSSWARLDYADLLTELDRGLVIAREPKPAEQPDDDEDLDSSSTPDTPLASSQAGSSKYVFASCRCSSDRRRPVTIRVASGSRRPGVIQCAVCETPFAES